MYPQLFNSRGDMRRFAVTKGVMVHSSECYLTREKCKNQMLDSRNEVKLLQKTILGIKMFHYLF